MTARPPRSIRSGDVVLVIHGAEAAAAMADAINESLDHLRPFMAWAQRPTNAREQALRLATAAEQAASGGDVVWSVTDGEGAIVGVCGLHDRGGESRLEIGYWLHPEATGRGYITMAAAAAARVAFEVMGAATVRITCDEANVRSAAVPKRLGFRHVETVDEKRGAPADTDRTMVWEITRSEWDASPAARIAVSYS